MIKKQPLPYAAIFIILISLSLFAQAANSERITWMGCGISKKAFMDAIAKAYTEKTEVKFRMAGGGATKGIRLTSNGQADVGGTCRHTITTGENASLESDVKLVHVAWDAIVAITNTSNPIKGITDEQLRDVYTGNITSWKQLGGKDQVIKLQTRSSKESGVGYMFRLLVFNDENYEFQAESDKYKSSGPLEKNIESRFEGGFGITGVSSAKKRALNILEINGVYPSKENIASGKYPYFRPLYLAVPKKPDTETQNIVDFILSDEGQQIISQEGTVNLKEGKKLNELWTLTKL
ncbi:MAG: substrate-binding domain-containing protein [Vibrio sp.]|uniref:substrate-binding domain-containing protein n=1 Tax=Vibrio TaxID=662 RepID=UPI001EC785C4|nr:substrate-binding domain-containing protein [Vibrio sp.]NRB69193.1 substrate-binding domain-containing protein [Vibrio sp.]